MHMKTSSLKRILAIGTITGMRSMSGLAAVASQHGGAVKHGIALLAAGEMVADKTTVVGDRTNPLPLGGRAMMGAVLGAWIAREHHDSILLGAALGGAAAVAATHLAYQLRTRWPDATTATGLVEDAIVVGAASLYGRRLASA
jgi:uncharacterized membrane protein